MKRATIEIPDELDAALAAYGWDQGATDGIDALVVVALRNHLEGHGDLVPLQPFRP